MTSNPMLRFYPKIACWFGVSVYLLSGLAHAAEVKKDIEYAKPGGVSVKLDACIPDGTGPFPVAILVHGGGWSNVTTDKTQEISPMFEPLTKAGIAWFSIDYRLAPTYRYPACIEDLESAVKWVKAHAREYNIDPNRLALIGESAGGMMVDMVAARATAEKPETRVAAVVAFYAPCDLVADALSKGGAKDSQQKLLGIPAGPIDEKTTKILHDASPTTYIHKDMPPFLLLHGTADTGVSHELSVEWQAKMKELGVPCELISIPGGPHVMGNWEKIDPTYKDKVTAWLLKTLNEKKPAPAAAKATTSAK